MLGLDATGHGNSSSAENAGDKTAAGTHPKLLGGEQYIPAASEHRSMLLQGSGLSGQQDVHIKLSARMLVILWIWA